MGTPFPGPPFLQPCVPRPQEAFFSVGIAPFHAAISIINELVNLNLVKIMALLQGEGGRCKNERGPQIFTGGRDFTVPSTLKLGI